MSKKICIYFFVILCLFLSACQSEKDGDTARLKTDDSALKEIARIDGLLKNNQNITQEDVDSLYKLRDKYRFAPNLRQTLQSALIIREDWGALEQLLQSVPETELTDKDKTTLSQVYFKLGHFEKLLNTVKPLVDKNPNNPDLVYLLTKAYFSLGKYEEAGKLLDGVWPQLLTQKRVDEITIRGMVYFYQNNPDKAIETINKALEIDADFIPANNALARVYTAKGDNKKAEEFNQKVTNAFAKATLAEKNKKNFVSSLYQLQEAFQAKRFEEVVTLANKLIPEADPKNKFALYQFLAQAYQALGKQNEAQNAITEAQKLQQQSK